ncbi:MAG: sulfurtransferase [Micavibrio sp.]|nr:sulfurtransferase [Micavibrio sp.]|tara:strand:- start:465 stop:1079 length:615 start_codon:yes stop_codon:yes gene_type:complete
MIEYKTIDAKALDKLDPQQGLILDVRTPMEHAEKRLQREHTIVPLDELDPNDFMGHHGLGKEANLYILCRSGKRAAQAAEKFTACGCNNIHVIDGGILACEEIGMPVEGHDTEHGAKAAGTRRPISLERQVRIAAGSIAATGALLALIIAPVFAVIPLFVGCGLIFAGITEWCGMALLLTKAPWNRQTPVKACCSVETPSRNQE